MTTTSMLPAISPFDAKQACETVFTGLEQPWTAWFDALPEQLNAWLTNADPQWTLHVSGSPRCGKTVFAAVLSGWLREHRDEDGGSAAVVTLLFNARTFRSITSRNLTLDWILRAILRQLLEQNELDANDIPGKSASLDELKHSISAHNTLRKTFLVLDDISDVPFLEEIELATLLQDLGFKHVVFVGPPINTLSYSDWVRGCDAQDCAGEPSWIWAECERHNRCHDPICYSEGKICCENMRPPSKIVELELRWSDGLIHEYVLHKLQPKIENEELLDNFVNALTKASGDSFALAKLNVDSVVDQPDFEEVPSIRDRLPLFEIRFFNFLLQKIKRLRSDQDRDLALAVLTLLTLAGDIHLSFDALRGALAFQSSGDRFGDITRARVSQVTQGWVSIEDQQTVGRSGEVMLFTRDAQTFLYEECPELFNEENAFCVLEHGRNFGSLCLQAINVSMDRFQKMGSRPEQDLVKDPEGLFLQYALLNWPSFYKRQADKDNAATSQFFHNLQNSIQLQQLYLSTNQDRRQSVSDTMHVLAEHNLWEMMDQQDDDAINAVCVLTSRTPLMIAAEAGHRDFVSLLLERQPDLLHTAPPGHSALTLAILRSEPEIVQSILKKADAALLNSQDEDGQTALMLAIKTHSEIARFSQNNQRVEKQAEKAELVLKHVVGHRALKLRLIDKNGKTALHHAAWYGNELALSKILGRIDGRQLVDVPEANASHRTALIDLMLAKYTDEIDIVTCFVVFVEHGATASLTDSHHRTVLHYAAANTSHEAIVRDLMEHGVDINLQDHHGWTALHTACIHKCECNVKILLESGADIALRDKAGRTSLDFAAASGNEAIVNLIKEAAAPRGRDGLVSIVENAQADETAIDVETLCHDILGHSDLHAAVNAADPERVEELLSSDVDLNATNVQGNTALHLAFERLDLAIEEDDCDAEDNTKDIIAKLVADDRVDLSLENQRRSRALDLVIDFIYPDDDLLFDILEKLHSSSSYYDTRSIPDVAVKFKKVLQDSSKSPTLLTALLACGIDIFRSIDSGTLPVYYMTAREFAEENGASEEMLKAIDIEEQRIVSKLRDAMMHRQSNN